MLRREEFLTLILGEGSHKSGNTVARRDYSRWALPEYSGIQRTSAMRWVSSSPLRLGATPSATAWTATAWAMRTAMSGTSGHAGNSGWSGSARAGDASPKAAAAIRIISSVTRVAWAAVTASP